jgi:hypothetical protein
VLVQWRRLLRGQGQFNPEFTAFTFSTAETYLTSHRFNQAFANTEPYTTAFSSSVFLTKALKGGKHSVAVWLQECQSRYH